MAREMRQGGGTVQWRLEEQLVCLQQCRSIRRSGFAKVWIAELIECCHLHITVESLWLNPCVESLWLLTVGWDIEKFVWADYRPCSRNILGPPTINKLMFQKYGWHFDEESWCHRKVRCAPGAASCSAGGVERLPGLLNDVTAGGSPMKITSAHSIQADIVAAALDTSSGGHHLLGALPTGFGKSLPMMVVALLLPPGITIKWISLNHGLMLCYPHSGSTVIVICPLTVIEAQHLQDCQRFGIQALAASQAQKL